MEVAKPVGTIDPDRAYPRRFTADALNVSDRTLARLIRAGKIQCIKVSERRQPITGREILRVLHEGVAA